MSSVILVLKLAIPFAAFIGICVFFTYRLKSHCAFSFALACGFIVLVTLIGGYSNLLPQSVLLLYAFGTGSLLYYLAAVLRKKQDARFFLTPPAVVFIAACAVCVLLLKDLQFATHDEYSHWGIMIKEMASLNALPDKSSIIRFIDYPPAAALFMYYFIYSTGFSQSLTYIAQAFFAMAPLMVFFRYSAFKKPLSLMAPLLFSIVLMLTFDSTLQYLLVDYLVGLYAVALTVIVLSEQETIAKAPVKASLTIMPVIIAASLIKTSALFYGVLASILIAGIVISERKSGMHLNNNKKLQLGVILSSPLWIWFLYQRHVQTLFGAGQYKTARFTLVPENIFKNFTDKPAEFRVSIVIDSVLSLFTVKTSLCALIILALCALVIVALKKAGAPKPVLLIKLTCAAAIGYFVYYFGYVLALLFMFPYDELLAFNTTTIAISRYISAASGACLGICFFGLLHTIDSVKSFSAIKQSCAAIAAALLFVPFINMPNANRYVYNDKVVQEMRTIEAFADKVLFKRDDKLFFYNGDYDDNDANCAYNTYTYAHAFLNNNISCFSNTNLDGGPYEYTDYKFRHYFLNNDYLVLMSRDPKLFEILNAAQISVDDKDGLIYKIEILDDGGLTLHRALL